MRKISKYFWFLILTALTSIIGYLVFSGGIRLFLSASLFYSVYIGFGLLVLLWIFYVIKMFTPNQTYSETFKLYNAVFLIPLLLFLMAKPTITTAGLLPNHHVSLTYERITSGNVRESGVQSTIATNQEESSSTANAAFIDKLIIKTPLTPCIVSDDKVNNRAQDEFSEMMGLSTDILKDHEVTVIGFIYKDENYPENTVLVSRLKIACCIADASLMGYHVAVDDADSLEAGEWVEVIGNVVAVDAIINGEAVTMPVIMGGTITPREPLGLEEAYVFSKVGRIRF